MTDCDVLECDFLVIGAGVAGLTAAAYAANQGLNVVVLEKAPDIGGSAILSGGGFWMTKNYEVMREINPLGDPDRARIMNDNFQDALDWIASTGTAINPVETGARNIAFERRFVFIDIMGYLHTCAAYVTHGGGHVVPSTETEELLQEDGAVCGARVRNSDGSRSIVRAKAVLLACGGFQNNPEMRATFIGEQARDWLTRSNPHSSGDGIRLGLAVGGALCEHMDSWYGHTIAYPLNRPMSERDFIPLAHMALNVRSLLIDHTGKRFRDETIAYYRNAQGVGRLPQARALMVFDELSHEEDSSLAATGFDRPTIAEGYGAHVIRSDDWVVIAAKAAEWGYPDVDRTVAEFNADILADRRDMDPPRERFRRPLVKPPFFAMEVQPAITFTHGGLRSDTDARVIDAAGQPVPGLYVAGADAGGTYHVAYSGGLSMGAIFGLQAARDVVSRCQAAELAPT